MHAPKNRNKLTSNLGWLAGKRRFREAMKNARKNSTSLR